MSKKLQNQSIEELLGLPPKIPQVPKIENFPQRPISRRGRNMDENKSFEITLVNEESENNSTSGTGRTSIQSRSRFEFVSFDEPTRISPNQISDNPSIYSDDSATTSSSSSSGDTSVSSDSVKIENSNNHSKTSNIFPTLIETSLKNDISTSEIQLKDNVNILTPPIEQTNMDEKKKELNLPGRNLIKKVIKPHSALVVKKNFHSSPETNNLKLINFNNNRNNLQREASVPKYDISQENKVDNLQRSKACYDIWLEKKNLEAMKKRDVGILTKKKEEEERELRMQTSLKIFEKWKRDFEEKTRLENLKKRHEREEENKKKDEEDKKRNDAKKMFLAWKNENDIKMKEKLKREEEEKIMKEKRMEDEKKEKLEESKKAFEAWKSQKEKELVENKRINKERLAILRKTKEDEKEFKDAIAKEAFEIWLTMKDQENEYKKSLAYKIEKFEEETRKKFKIPWIPASNTIPKSITDRVSRSSQSLSRPKSGKNERGSSKNRISNPKVIPLRGRIQASSATINRTKSVSFLPWR